jgi:hypothetical protein
MRKRLAAVVLLVVTALFGTATAASADPRDGICQAGEQCLYPFPDFYGSVADMPSEVDNYACCNFIGPGAYSGYPLNDNVMSLKNRNAWFGTRYCQGSYMRGPCFNVSAGYTRSTLNEHNNLLSSHLMWIA